jgi:hypothetical protein
MLIQKDGQAHETYFLAMSVPHNPHQISWLRSWYKTEYSAVLKPNPVHTLFPKIHFNTILPSPSCSWKWLISKGFLYQCSKCISCFSYLSLYIQLIITSLLWLPSQHWVTHVNVEGIYYVTVECRYSQMFMTVRISRRGQQCGFPGHRDILIVINICYSGRHSEHRHTI